MSLGAIVLAAGKGTRMRSPRSKLLHVLLNEPLVSYPLYALYQAGVRELVVVVGHEAEAVEKAIRALPFLQDCKLTFVLQTPQNGTGHAVQMALAAVTQPPAKWVIAYGDSPHLDVESVKGLIDGPGPLQVLAAEVEDPTGYGRMIVSAGKLQRIVEDKDCTAEQKAVRLVNAGTYAVEHAFLAAGVAKLEPKNAQNELYLTDIANFGEGRVVTAKSPHVVLGVNSQAELMRSTQMLQDAIIARWHDEGVSIQGRDVVIGPRVTFKAGAVVERGVTLIGDTHVEGHVEHHAHLFNTFVAERARVKAFTYAEDSRIGVAAVIGPMARLRNQAEIEEQAEIGNFCEVKKSRVKKKAKSHHVSYLGDAEVGSGTNIGAGTIICNYNGFTKPFSRIGDDVFIGSNSTLVAPVDIAANAYVAAGSVITDPVPSDAVAFGRARQDTKAGYAAKLRERLKAQKK